MEKAVSILHQELHSSCTFKLIFKMLGIFLMTASVLPCILFTMVFTGTS